MRKVLLLALLLVAAGCGRDVPLGAEQVSTGTGQTTAGGGCRGDADCGASQRCVAGACQSTTACSAGAACDTGSGSFCAESCPTCTAGARCCMDNGFGQCQCFCGLSCGGPACAPAGSDPGPLGASCGQDADCLCGERCANGACQAGPVVIACTSSLDCAGAGCGADACVGGRCVPPGWQCVNDRECGAAGSGYACQAGACVCASRAGQACTDSSQCSACAGETCRSGACGIFTTSSGAASGGITGGTSSGGTSGATAGTTGTGTSGASGSSGGSSGCTCSVDADCNDAFHEGYVCAGGFCAPGPSSASLSSTGGLCAGQGGGGTSGSGSVGSSSGGGSGSVGTSGSTGGT